MNQIKKVKFNCEKCGNLVKVDQSIFDVFYKNTEICKSCRPQEETDDFINAMLSMDVFYRNLTDSMLRAAYETIVENIEKGILVDGMKKEKGLIKSVAMERGINLDDDSISAKIDTTKGYIEFYEDKNTIKE